MWMRPCPCCGAELSKRALDVVVECSACGWTWRGVAFAVSGDADTPARELAGIELSVVS